MPWAGRDRAGVLAEPVGRGLGPGELPFGGIRRPRRRLLPPLGVPDGPVGPALLGYRQAQLLVEPLDLLPGGFLRRPGAGGTLFGLVELVRGIREVLRCLADRPVR